MKHRKSIKIDHLKPLTGQTVPPSFLPTSRSDMEARGWKKLDILLISGDAYIDHPSFGTALIGRILESEGFKVGIISQPNWETTDDIMRMGRPGLFAAVSSGAVDSMVAHYTAFRKKRSDDAYTPGGKAGARPNRAVIVYTSLIKRAFPRLPVVIGGIEASLRRYSHYDFWTDKLRRSILLDSKADILVYGMAEKSIVEIARAYEKSQITEPPHTGDRKLSPLFENRLLDSSTPYTVRGTVVRHDAHSYEPHMQEPSKELPSHEEILKKKSLLIDATKIVEEHVHSGQFTLLQKSGTQTLITNRPSIHLTTAELDAIYALPFTRKAHPSYIEPVTADSMIKFSITSHRGCSGGCSFCALASHQGRIIRSRSAESIVSEITAMTSHNEFRGSISDIGGPSANMWQAQCTMEHSSKCKRASCLYPSICSHYKDSQKNLIKMLEVCSSIKGVKNIRIASGVRHDLAERTPEYYKPLIAKYIGGQLKLAPEHSDDKVLRLMRKPSFTEFIKFMKIYEDETRALGMEQYVIPYLLTAFPGCTVKDMEALAGWLRKRGWKPQQIQCFIPTPGTVATAMFYSGRDEQGNPIEVARTDNERLKQHWVLASLLDCPGQKKGHSSRPASLDNRRSKNKGRSHSKSNSSNSSNSHNRNNGQSKINSRTITARHKD
jgi:uncharacterized radical SAM protein YgiQ